QPECAVRRAAPVQDGVERGRAVGRPALIDIRAVREQGLEHRDIAGARGHRQGDAVVRIGAGVEQRGDQRQRLRDAGCAPEDRTAHVVMEPGELRVWIDAEADETARDVGETAGADGRVADIVNRQPAARPARSGCEGRILRESSIHRGGVTEDERGVEIRGRDLWMQGEDALSAITAVVGRRFQELRYRRSEFERTRFHLFAQLVPGRESVFAREPRLRLMQSDTCGVLKLFRLTFELFEIGMWGELLAGHKASMLSASGPQAGQHGEQPCSELVWRVDSVLRADPRAPRARGKDDAGAGWRQAPYKSPARYLSPLSTATVTTVCPAPISRASCSAATTLSPVDVPANRPSCRANVHAIRRASASSIARVSLTSLRSNCGGTNPGATPSTPCRPGALPESTAAVAGSSAT